MMQAVTSQPLLGDVVDRLVKEFHPEEVILFGSYAWGEPGPSSDLDLLVIIPHSDQTPVQRAIQAQRSLRGLLIAVDVLVKTRSEVERYHNVRSSLESQILEKGKVLYGRKARIGQKLAD